MKPNLIRSLTPVLVVVLIAMLACNLPGTVPTSAPTPTPTQEQQIALVEAAVRATEIPVTPTVMVTHVMTPTDPRGGKQIYDVESAGTASEQRAPYGDSYDINRLERPFLQDMTYVSDLDIVSFTVAKDSNWWYVSMELTGVDPNNALGISYGVEIDLNKDGFGDYLIWTHPPYTPQWDTLPVQVYQDNNHNTGGLSSGKSDAPFTADGYETLILDGSTGGDDPDLAWVRINAGADATVQFAFKRSWAGSVFMLGVIADAGLKDPKQLDYVDRFQIAEAGSSVKDNQNYPLKSLFSVDNTCREAFGFEPTRYEPGICPVEPTPTKAPRLPQPEKPDGPTPVPGCQPPSGGCGTYHVWNSSTCRCDEVVY